VFARGPSPPQVKAARAARLIACRLLRVIIYSPVFAFVSCAHYTAGAAHKHFGPMWMPLGALAAYPRAGIVLNGFRFLDEPGALLSQKGL